MNRPHFPERFIEPAALLLIILVAAALRFAQLDAIPPGLTHDEAGHGHDAIRILYGARPIYLTVGYGREPLYDYVNAAAMSLLGPAAYTMRLTSAFAGLLLIPITYRFAQRGFGATAALVTAALLAISFWPVAVSRQVLRSSLLPVLFTAAVLSYWTLYSPVSTRSSKRQLALTALFGVLISATLYTYIAARILWVAFAAFLLYLALFHRADFRRLAAPALGGLLAAGLLAWPMFDYLNAHPDAEARLSMLDAPLQALQRGDVSVVLNEATSAIAAWFVPGRGDDFLAYTIRGRPVFDPITFALFALGLIVCLKNFRRPEYAFLLIWLAVGVSPSLLTGNDASLTRSIGALPVFYILPALGCATGAQALLSRTRRGMESEHSRRKAALPKVAGAGLVGLIVYTALTTVHDYFTVWGQSPDVRAAYQRTVVEMANAVAPGDNAVISSVYPTAPHDPYVAQVALSLDHPPFRWIDARAALIIPDRPATLLIPASTPPDRYFADLIGRPVERVLLQAGDLDPYFDVYRWDTFSASNSALIRAMPLAHNFSDAVELIGVDLRTPQIDASGHVELATFWRVIDPGRAGPRGGPADATDAVLFTHALDSAGVIVGQRDRLDAPSWSWQAGDLVIQIHRFALDVTPAPGPLSLEVGIYDRASGARLPLIAGGVVSGDSIIAGTVEVQP